MVNWEKSYLFLCLVPLIVAYDPIPRWGQAIAIKDDVLYVHGGKIDPTNSYSYSGAPVSNDLLRLSLSAPFVVNSPPWQLIDTSSISSSFLGPGVAWHTLSVVNSSHILLFGGQPGPSSPTTQLNLADSVNFLDTSNSTSPVWRPEGSSWAGEPQRRIHHSTATDDLGRVYIIGGETADGSNFIFSQHYLLQPSVPSFSLLPTENGPPDIFGHASTMLPDGRLLVFGGYSQSLGSLVPLSMIWVLDTTRNPLFWVLFEILNVSLPNPRRSFAVAALNNGNILVHGGSDTFQNNFADGWILNTSIDGMAWQQRQTLSQLGPRRDHFAATTGNQVIFEFGYTDNSPAAPAMQVYDYVMDAFVPRFVPPLPLSSNPLSSSTLNSTKVLSPLTTPTSSTRPSAHPSDVPIEGRRRMAIVIGAVLSVLGLIILAILVMHYLWRRTVTAHGRGFVALEQGDNDDRDSLHVAGGPVVISLLDEPYLRNQMSWNTRLLRSLASVFGGSTGFGRLRDIPTRRYMLAEEDSWEFRSWHSRMRRDRNSGSSWSLRNILFSVRGSREPSISDVQDLGSRSEKRNTSTNASVQTVNEERRQYPIECSPHQRLPPDGSDSKSYADPFSDSQAEKLRDFDPMSHSNQADSKILDLSYRERTLSTLSEHTSHNTLSVNGRPSSSHSSIRSQAGLISTVAGSKVTPLIRRSDSWWARLSRTRFLERRLSSASKASVRTPEFRDPNPLPIFAVDNTTIRHLSNRNYSHKSRALSAVYEFHSKSRTSVGTADTDLLEKMARTADVQILRSGSQATASTNTAEGRHIHNRSESITRDHLERSRMSTSPSASDVHSSSPSTHSTASPVSGVPERPYQLADSSRLTKRMSYGLISRPSLFITNPDYRIISNESQY